MSHISQNAKRSKGMTKASSWCARLVSIAILGALLTAATATQAAAQTSWSGTAYGVGEYDTDQTFLILGGVVFGPSGMGWHPHLGVQAYNVSFDAGTARTSVTSVKPFVGLTNRFNDGAATLSVGYAFTNREVPIASSAVGESGDGVVVSGGWQTYGSTTPLAYQLLGSYNFGSEAIWARGRATGKISGTGPKTQRLGGELAIFHEDNFTVWQPGAVLEFHSGSSVLGLGAGMKFFEGGNNVYFKVEGSLPLGGR
jgi:hypothetical protein